jgi:glycosyltransferase involved in cell wall biosynthesis
VAGDGPERNKVTRLADEIAPGRVQFLGVVADAASVYAAADTIVVSSHTEGLPGVLMEAGLSGLPAVTTDVGFVREIIRDGETGFVVPPNEPAALGAGLLQALEAPASMGLAARAHCLAHFGLARIAERWDTLLTSVVEGSKP